MREWAGRHPFFLQLLGFHLLDGHRSGEPLSDALDGTDATPKLAVT